MNGHLDILIALILVWLVMHFEWSEQWVYQLAKYFVKKLCLVKKNWFGIFLLQPLPALQRTVESHALINDFSWDSRIKEKQKYTTKRSWGLSTAAESISKVKILFSLLAANHYSCCWYEESLDKPQTQTPYLFVTCWVMFDNMAVKYVVSKFADNFQWSDIKTEKLHVVWVSFWRPLINFFACGKSSISNSKFVSHV